MKVIPSGATVQSEIRRLYKSKREVAAPDWPPDVFALSCYLLKHSGAYHQVVEKWPPSVKGTKLIWKDLISSLGQEWRHHVAAKPPKAVQEWWRQLISYAKTPLVEIASNRNLCEILLQLLAISDEASRNFGIRGEDSEDFAAVEALKRLTASDTLCRLIDPGIVRILPKLRTPQSGLTVRSLSHHLAMVEGSEIRASWWPPPVPHRDSLRLLLLPWPMKIAKSQFQPVVSNLKNMPEKYGLFAYRAHSIPDIRLKIEQVLDAANKAIDDPDRIIDGLLLPELALTPEDYTRAQEVCMKRRVFLISGVARPAEPGSDSGSNCVLMSIPDSNGAGASSEPQNKHHRWQLDESQIKKYGLDGQLDPSKIWWEATRMERRRLTFVSMFDWLTAAVLICEDLARPDPVGDLIRSVGPNLVITLLMDAAQEPWRWAARYALALSDDPGCSVLTFTSLGMTRMGSPATQHKIALWKDRRAGLPISVELPNGAAGVVLDIRHEESEEWTADGRGDQAATSHPILKRIIPVGAGDPVEC